MTRTTVGELGAIAPIADREMRRWALHLQATKGLTPERAVARLPADVRPYVALSREAGAGGGELGRAIAERLGGQCLDTQLLTYMAERYGLPAGLLDLVDETASSWLYETFRLWLDRRAITQDEYVMRLGQLALLAAREGTAVLVGRGIQFLLPRARALAVRVIAPLEQRIQRTMERRGLGRETAAHYVRDSDAGRVAFIRRHFHRDATDPHLYDLVVNLESLDRDRAADVVAEAFRRRFDLPAASR